MKRTRNLLIIAAVLAIVVAVAALSGKHGDAGISVATDVVKRTSFQTKLPENGVVQHPRTATVPTLVAGNLEAMYARPGDSVTAGQVLATVRNVQLESSAASSAADYSQAVAEIETAKIDSQNARVGYEATADTAKSNMDEAQRVYAADVALYAQKAIPRNQLDTDKAKLDQAKVQYAQAVRQLRLGAVTGYGQNSVQAAEANARKMAILNASNQQQLDFSRIVAPFTGVIQSVATQPGDPLTPLRAGDAVTQGQALFSIAERGNFTVKAQVDEQDVINVHPGQEAQVTSEDFPGKTLTGRVTSVSPIAIRSTDASSTARQVLTTIVLNSSPAFLRDGMSVDVDILTANLRNVLAVPSAAILREGGKPFVYVLEKGKARKTAIRTGDSNDTQTIVLSGLLPGDRIVTGKDPLLKDGAAVSPASPAPSASPAG